MEKIKVFLLIILFCGNLCACNKNTQTISNKTEFLTDETVINTTASELIKQFSNIEETDIDNCPRGKKIQISGEIFSIGRYKEKRNRDALCIVFGDKGKDGWFIFLYFNEKNTVNNLLENDTVTIQGQFSDFRRSRVDNSITIELRNCKIIESTS